MSSKSSKSGGDSYRMERSSTSTSDSGFWTTIDLLMEREWKKKKWETPEDNQDQSSKDVNILLKGKRKVESNLGGGRRFSQFTSKLKFMEDAQEETVPGAKLSLWTTPRNAMTSQKGKGERYVDKEMLKRLQQTKRQEKMEAQQHRMKNREIEEKDRLKNLILNGRFNLEECPPDMRNNPVCVFWRLVNKEVEKMNRARADAYYRKYRKSRRGTRRCSQRELVCPEEDSIVSKCEDSPKSNDERESDIKETINISFNIPDCIKNKYEDEGVKELRKLMTVQELYQMADKIIGTPREIVEDDASTR